MPRFSDAATACLKRVMATRASDGFCLRGSDVTDVVRETGLEEAQVKKWAENVRTRYAVDKDRLDFLLSDGFEKV